MKYLIVECRELCDQYECDADRTPICVTDDFSEYGYGYEVWGIQEDGTLNKIKDADEALESGMALYYWDSTDDSIIENVLPTIIEKWPEEGRFDCSREFVKEIMRKAHFTEANCDEIYVAIRCEGAYAEEIGKKWVVFGRYDDNSFNCGY